MKSRFGKASVASPVGGDRSTATSSPTTTLAVLQGLYSIADGVAALRTHEGSAHGRSSAKTYRLAARHARLTVHAAYTMALFILETWEALRDASGLKVSKTRRTWLSHQILIPAVSPITAPRSMGSSFSPVATILRAPSGSGR